MNIKLTIFLIILNLSAFAQKTFNINKNDKDSITLKDYKIFSVSANVAIDFIGKKIPKSKRYHLTKEDIIIADNEFRKQYIKASIQQYYKQQNDPELFSDSSDLTTAKLHYSQTIKKFIRNVTKDQKNKIENYDRYFYGYLNDDNERLVLMRFDPHKIRYFSVPGAGESLMDVLTIYILNLNTNELSLAGWANFKE